VADTLNKGDSLRLGQALQSNNRNYWLGMQNDGNLAFVSLLPPTTVWQT
jgi:hypothetical protein